MGDSNEFIIEGKAALKTGHGGPWLDTSSPLGLALSGGGHRATLFGLGVLMAMKDAGRLPEQISSVSGGSITNAVLARNYFSKITGGMSAEEKEKLWQQETYALFNTIVTKGILTKNWIRALLLFMVLPPAGLIILAILGMLPAWYVTVPIIAVWLILVLLRGLLIEWLITKRFFSKTDRKNSIETLHNKEVNKPIEHVICCTDLITGRPLYVSSRDSGQIYRKFTDRPVGLGPRTMMPFSEADKITSSTGIKYDTLNLSLSALVRASAGFPGIPPRRIKLPVDNDKDDESQNISPLAFLSDGGVWNNLATQPFEDGYLWGDYGPWVVLVADASAPLDHITPFNFHIPGIAEILALVRQAIILNINTVGPRRLNYQDWIRRELLSPGSARLEAERLFPVVSCMETPGDVKDRLHDAVNKEDWNDYSLVEAHRERREEQRRKTLKRAEMLTKNGVDNTDSVDEEDIQIDPDAVEKYQLLCDISTNKNSNDPDSDGIAFYPTTLDKVDRKIAQAMVGRGYANTSLTLYLTGLADNLVTPDGWLKNI